MDVDKEEIVQNEIEQEEAERNQNEENDAGVNRGEADEGENRRKDDEGTTAEVLSGLSGHVLDEKMRGSLDLVDITYTCKVCFMKAKSLQELMGHMKDGQCTTKRRPRGRPRKVHVPDEEKPPPKPAPAVSVQPSERITRVKSGAIKRKSVADLFIKQEPTSSDEDYEDPPKRRKKLLDLDAVGDVGKTEKLAGTQALAANKDAVLSGHEVRIPIGSLRDGQPKIIKLNTSTGDGPEELSGSVLQIREVDSKPIVEVLSEAHETLNKASTTIYLRTGAKQTKEEGEEEVGETEETEENVHYVDMEPQEIISEIADTKLEHSDSNQELSDLQNVHLVQPEDVEDDDDDDIHEPKKRRYTKLPSTIESDGVVVEQTTQKPSFSTKCKKCVQRWFQSQEELDIHYRLHAPGVEGYQCDKCDYKCNNWGRMQYHIVKHPEYFERLRGMPMMKNIFGAFRCPECGKMFEFKCNLSTHFAKMHNSNSKFCSNCMQVFENMDDKKFERHTDRCKGEELVCEFCPYTTSIRSNMKIHMRVHSGQGLSCDICGKVFPTKQRQEVHRQKHLADRPRFPCEHCGADFCSKDAVKKHVARIHMEKEILYKCSMCTYTTKHEVDFKKHVKCVHEKKFLCPEDGCQYGTNRSDQLTMHKEYHNPDRIFKCSYANCFTAFSSQRNLLGHMQGVHKIGCKHQCPICLKYFRKKTVLLRHLVSHTTERPYACHECGASFACHSTYYRHRRRSGHDARREGVASVPQNITIQYLDDGDGETGGSQQHQIQVGDAATDMALSGVTVIDESSLPTSFQTTSTTTATVSTDSLINVTDASQVITLDAAQFAQLQQQQPLTSALNDGNVTYYVYEDESTKNEKILVMDGDLTHEKQSLEAIPLEDDNTDLRSEIEDYNSQFINLDLPNGPALVKVDDNGSLMVMNALGHALKTEEIVAETEDSVSKDGHELLNLEAMGVSVEDNPMEENIVHQQHLHVGSSDDALEGAQVVYHEMSDPNDGPKEQYIIYTTNGDGTVVEGESAAAYSMLQLHDANIQAANLQ